MIWLLSDSGALKTLEPNPAQGRAPVWSPDGTHVAFESDRGSPDGHYAIFVIGRDGTGLTQVTDYTLNANHPVWSPHGRQMVFAATSPGSGGFAIALVDLPDRP